MREIGKPHKDQQAYFLTTYCLALHVGFLMAHVQHVFGSAICEKRKRTTASCSCFSLTNCYAWTVPAEAQVRRTELDAITGMGFQRDTAGAACPTKTAKSLQSNGDYPNLVTKPVSISRVVLPLREMRASSCHLTKYRPRPTTLQVLHSRATIPEEATCPSQSGGAIRQAASCEQVYMDTMSLIPAQSGRTTEVTGVQDGSSKS